MDPNGDNPRPKNNKAAGKQIAPSSIGAFRNMITNLRIKNQAHTGEVDRMNANSHKIYSSLSSYSRSRETFHRSSRYREEEQQN